jgi:hypothetical protein
MLADLQPQRFILTYSRTAISVRAAAATVSALGIASSAAEVFTAATVVPVRDGGSLGGNGCGRGVVTARQAASAAMSVSVAAPSVRRAAGTLVDCAVRVTEQVAVGRTTLAVLGVLGLPLLGNDLEVRSRDLGVITLDIGDARAVLTTVLACQTAIGCVDVAGRVDPAKVDVGRGEPGESAEGDDRGPHC